MVPSINVVEAIGWDGEETPAPAEGLAIVAFARSLDHPRWLHVLPNGDVLVAETNAPPRPDDNTGVRGWFFSRFQKKAGGAVPSANRISLLRDADGNGVAETKTVFMQGLNSPFGMALVGEDIYVANTDAVVKVPYTEGVTTISAAPVKVLDLPAGPRNHHWTKNIIASPTAGASTSRLAPTATSERTVSTKNKGEPSCGSWICRPALTERMPVVSAILSGWPGTRSPTSCGCR